MEDVIEEEEEGCKSQVKRARVLEDAHIDYRATMHEVLFCLSRML